MSTFSQRASFLPEFLNRVDETIVFHPLRNASGLHPMVAAIGVLLFLEAAA